MKMQRISPGLGGRTTTATAVAALLVSVAACSSSGSKTAKAKQTPSPTATTASASATPSAMPSARPTSTPKPTAQPPASPRPTALATVPAVPVRTRPPVPPASVATFGGGVSARITKVASVKSAGTGPGEIRGAASVALTLTVTNGSARSLSLDTVAVSATYGADQTPASPSSGPPSAPFHGTVAARASASGIYVFEIPQNARGNVSVSISYTASAPTVFFQGALA
jgi:hypothetical protein